MGSAGERLNARLRRQARVRKRVRGTDTRPRLSVYRSNRYIYAQVISDESGRTLASLSTLKLRDLQPAGPTLAAASALGKAIAERCKQLAIQELIFDRGGYRYHGRVKAIAEAAREAGLKL